MEKEVDEEGQAPQFEERLEVRNGPFWYQLRSLPEAGFGVLLD